MNNNQIPYSNNPKYLGVTLDLSFAEDFSQKENKRIEIKIQIGRFTPLHISF